MNCSISEMECRSVYWEHILMDTVILLLLPEKQHYSHKVMKCFPVIFPPDSLSVMAGFISPNPHSNSSHRGRINS